MKVKMIKKIGAFEKNKIYHINKDLAIVWQELNYCKKLKIKKNK